MRILLNLLPQEKKEALSSRFYFRFFTWQTFLLLVLELFYITVLVAIFFLLNYQVQSKEMARQDLDTQNVEAKRLARFQSKFKEANALAQNVGKFTSNHLEWAGFLVTLDKLIPEGIVLTDVATRDYTFTLNGQAATRANFLEFESKLKDSDCVSDVKVPISNLFSETEIEFQIEFNVKRECLKESS